MTSSVNDSDLETQFGQIDFETISALESLSGRLMLIELLQLQSLTITAHNVDHFSRLLHYHRWTTPQ